MVLFENIVTSAHELQTAQIAGIAVGIAAFVIILGAGFFGTFLYRKRQQNSNSNSPSISTKFEEPKLILFSKEWTIEYSELQIGWADKNKFT